MKAIYDSGSEISILSEKDLKTISQSSSIQKLPFCINATAANGEALPLKGCYRLNTSFEGEEVKQIFYVCPALKTSIVGIDLINALSLVYNPVEQTVTRTPPAYFTARTKKREYVAARSIQVMTVCVRNNNKELMKKKIPECQKCKYPLDLLTIRPEV